MGVEIGISERIAALTKREKPVNTKNKLCYRYLFSIFILTPVREMLNLDTKLHINANT